MKRRAACCWRHAPTQVIQAPDLASGPSDPVPCCCAGSIYSRGGRAEATGPIAIPPTLTLEGSEGIVLRLGADGKTYTLLLFTGAPGGTAVAHGSVGRHDFFV